MYNKTNLYNEFFENINNPKYRRFPFLWFFSCHFHDLGFLIEDDKTAINGIITLSDLKKRYSIDNCLLSSDPKDINRTLFGEIENYFNYRLNEQKVIDHGIIGGLFFFDRLVMKRRQKVRQYDNSLFWGEEPEEQYAQVAAAIATHNIWLHKNHQHDIYKNHRLHELIDNFQTYKLIFNLLKYKYKQNKLIYTSY